MKARLVVLFAFVLKENQTRNNRVSTETEDVVAESYSECPNSRVGLREGVRERSRWLGYLGCLME